MVAVLAGGLLFAATSNGLLVALRDNPVYMSSAESLRDGDGYRTPFGDPGKAIDFESNSAPVVDFPVGYPLTLAAGLTVSDDIDSVARWTGILLVAATAAILAMVASRHGLTPMWSAVVALTGAALVFQIALGAMSEPLYIVLLVVTLWAMGRYLWKESVTLLAIGTVAAALSVFVRTTGLALVATVGVIALLGAGSRRTRLIRGFSAVVVGLVPFLFLSLSGGSRELVWHPPGPDSVKVLLNTVASWFVPPVGTPTLRVAVLAVALVAAAFWWFAGRDGSDSPAPGDSRRGWLPGVTSAVLHFVLLVASIFLFDAQNELGRRLMLPVAVSLLVAGLAAAGREQTGTEQSSRLTQILAGALLAALVANTWAAAIGGFETADGRRGFNSPQFHRSEVVAAAVDLGATVDVFSNIPDGLWYVEGPGARALPVVVDPLSLQRSRRLEEESARIKELVETEDAVILYERGTREYMISEDDALDLAPCVILDDGAHMLLGGESSPFCP